MTVRMLIQLDVHLLTFENKALLRSALSSTVHKSSSERNGMYFVRSLWGRFCVTAMESYTTLLRLSTSCLSSRRWPFASDRPFLKAKKEAEQRFHSLSCFSFRTASYIGGRNDDTLSKNAYEYVLTTSITSASMSCSGVFTAAPVDDGGGGMGCECDITCN